jgi:hypothetical protein
VRKSTNEEGGNQGTKPIDQNPRENVSWLIGVDLLEEW